MNDGKLLFFIKGRLRFNDSNMGAPFPSVLIRLDKETHHHIYQNGTVEEFIERIVL